tara:strand:+ start:879 stop:1343 length:465 start_codon:yes stop_codon:yes gene_type:complete
MKNAPYFVIMLVLALFPSCSKDEAAAPPAKVNEVIVNSKAYTLTAVNGSSVAGTATFTKDSNNNTTILIEMESTNTAEHPAYIRFNSAAEGGTVAITLTVCTCTTGTTVVTKLDDGTPINFEGLLKLDGHISIHDSSTNLGLIIATADIGSNGN